MMVDIARRKTKWCLFLDHLESFDVSYNAIQLIRRRNPRKPKVKPHVYMIDAPPGPDRDHFIQNMYYILGRYRTDR
jgi:hypothetical protein